MTVTLRTLAATAVATLALAGGGLAVAVPADADAPAGTFEIDYDASGTSFIAKPKSTVKLGPAVSKTYISDSGDGTFTGDLALPPTQSTFKILGLIPVSATVTFVPAAPLSGQISDTLPLRLSATASYYLKLTNVKAAGLPTFQGNSCQTAAPVTIPVATPAGESFDLTNGGDLTGTYTIGKFSNCGLTTGLINLLVPGPNNTVTFTLSNGRFVG